MLGKFLFPGTKRRALWLKNGRQQWLPRVIVIAGNFAAVDSHAAHVKEANIIEEGVLLCPALLLRLAFGSMKQRVMQTESTPSPSSHWRSCTWGGRGTRTSRSLRAGTRRERRRRGAVPAREARLEEQVDAAVAAAHGNGARLERVQAVQLRVPDHVERPAGVAVVEGVVDAIDVALVVAEEQPDDEEALVFVADAHAGLHPVEAPERGEGSVAQAELGLKELARLVADAKAQGQGEVRGVDGALEHGQALARRTRRPLATTRDYLTSQS